MNADTDAGQAASPAAQRWAEQLAAWAIPEEIMAAAPESPYGFDVGLFAAIADEAQEEETPSERVAFEVLPAGGSVLDVGCGGGAGALPLAPPAKRLLGVDESAGMLEAFTERAAARGADSKVTEGRWPDVAGRVPAADLVVCHNVFHNVADIDPFVRALTDHARVRVVVELTQQHPLAWMNPYWRELHDLDRPTGPTADDAVEVVRHTGVEPAIERWERPMPARRSFDEQVAFVRKRLCVSADRDDEIARLLERHPPPTSRPAATLWWDV